MTAEALDCSAVWVPVTCGNRAMFRYDDRPASEVLFAADSTDWQTIPMERAGEAWTFARTYPEDARDEYMLVADGQWILDPRNPLRGPGGFGPHSACHMPRYEAPRPIELPVDGTMERRRMAGRVVDVYVPARPEGAATLIVQDGLDYIWFTGMPGLLDSLIRENIIPPTLAVFVSPRQRWAEYYLNDAYVDWSADGLLPAVRRRYGVQADPAWHGLVGASLGGLIATYGVVRRADAFHLAGAQSPAFRLFKHLPERLRSVSNGGRDSLRFHVDGGVFEMTLHGQPYLPNIREGVATLRREGCAVQYNEVNEGHNWTNWRGRLTDLLTWLLPSH